MKTATVTISPDVMDVLERSKIGERNLSLPEQLDRKLYMAVNKVIELAGGKWNKSAKCHVFPGDPKRILGMAMEEGEIVDEKKTFQAFYTPEDVALRMVQIAKVKTGMIVLEPSAGEGAIATAIERAGGVASCVEIRPEAVAKLKSLGMEVVEMDFLKYNTTRREFAVILMNPPFSNNQDIQHVTHALKLLKPGGTLVAIMSPGFTTDSNISIRKDFAAKVRLYNGTWEALPAGTFKEAGTGVHTIMLTITRPSES